MKIRGRRWLQVRRPLEVLVVIVALPLLALIGAAAMAAVFVEDRHWPLIRLARVGRFGEELSVTKIRSMRVGGGSAITASSDTRITRVGAAIRSLRIDEIPQVIKVLEGDMALIGPRPETLDFVDMQNPDWEAVLQERPAIAGMTQVLASAWEAEQLGVADPEQRYREIAVPAKLAIDRWYVENATPTIDLKVVASIFLALILGSEQTPIHNLVRQHVPEAAPLFERGLNPEVGAP